MKKFGNGPCKQQALFKVLLSLKSKELCAE